MALRPIQLVASMAALISAVLPASSTASREPDDWDLVVDAERQVTEASVQFASGESIAVLCQVGDLRVGVGGTPLTNREFHVVEMIRGDGEARETYWNGGRDAMMATNASARVARFLLNSSGRLSMRSRADQADPVHIEIELPSQSAAVAHVLTECGIPLSDSRDSVENVGRFLTSIPLVQAPDDVLRGGRGILRVELSCLIRDARLVECQSDREQPRDRRAGRAIARSAEGTRVSLTDADSAEGKLVDLVVTTNRIGGANR